MSGDEIETKIAKIFMNLANGERKSEISKEVLCDNKDFNPYQIFKLLDVENKNYIDKNNIINFLSSKGMPVNDLEAKLLILFYDLNYDGVLSFYEFINLIKSKKIKEFRNVNVSQNNSPNFNICYSFFKLLENEIELAKKIIKLLNDIKENRNIDIHDLYHKIKVSQYIDEQGIKNFLDENNQSFLDSDIKAIINRLDFNKDGLVDLCELQAFLGFPKCHFCCPCIACCHCGVCYCKRCFYNYKCKYHQKVHKSFNSPIKINKKINNNNQRDNYDEMNLNSKNNFNDNQTINNYKNLNCNFNDNLTDKLNNNFDYNLNYSYGFNINNDIKERPNKNYINHRYNNKNFSNINENDYINDKYNNNIINNDNDINLNNRFNNINSNINNGKYESIYNDKNEINDNNEYNNENYETNNVDVNNINDNNINYEYNNINNYNDIYEYNNINNNGSYKGLTNKTKNILENKYVPQNVRDNINSLNDTDSLNNKYLINEENSESKKISRTLFIRPSPDRKNSPEKSNQQYYDKNNNSLSNNNINPLNYNNNTNSYAQNEYEENQFDDFLRQMMEAESQIEKIKVSLALRPDFNCEDCFRIFEIDQKGNLDTDDFKKGLELIGVFYTDFEINLLFKRFDLKKSGYINYPDFFDIFVPFQKEYRLKVEERKPNSCCPCRCPDVFCPETIALIKNLMDIILKHENNINFLRRGFTTLNLKLKNIFENIDISNNGYLSNEDLEKYLKKKGIYRNDLDKELLFIRLDKNRNGKIDYQEIYDETHPLYL